MEWVVLGSWQGLHQLADVGQFQGNMWDLPSFLLFLAGISLQSKKITISNDNKLSRVRVINGIKCTSEQYCPSLKEQLCGVDGMDINIKLSGEIIRDFVKCIDCNKPRYIKYLNTVLN